MDALANVGRAFSTPQFFVLVVLALVLIGYGIYALSSGTGPNMLAGGMAVGLGLFMIIGGWIQRKLIRSNPEIAALAGAIDIARLARRL